MHVFLLVWVKTSSTWCNVLNFTVYNYFRLSAIWTLLDNKYQRKFERLKMTSDMDGGKVSAFAAQSLFV